MLRLCKCCLGTICAGTFEDDIAHVNAWTNQITVFIRTRTILSAAELALYRIAHDQVEVIRRFAFRYPPIEPQHPVEP